MCIKCGRKHVGTICPGSGNRCFNCKEKGHMKRFCPRLAQKVNVVEVGRPSTTGQVSTVGGTDMTDVDGLIRDNRMVTVITSDLVVSTPICVLVVVSTFVFKSPVVVNGVIFTVDSVCLSLSHADKAVAVVDLCDISDQASGMGPVSAKRVRNSLQKRDRGVPAVTNDIGNARYSGGVPQLFALNVVLAKVFLFRERQCGNSLEEWDTLPDPRLSERVSLGREMAHLGSGKLGDAEGFSPRRGREVCRLEDPRLSENPSLECERQF
ncbi:hypothetical protein Lal_00008094 [Lupinus albus]|nr:hypothetical protein Lal_00008094 [Lupinus albus]